jgi:diphthine synthase
MLYLIGLGLSFKDLSVKSLETLKKCDEVYLENYTSASDFSLKKLETLIGKKVKVLSREQVEIQKPFFVNAKTKKVALLIYGDVLSATTHTEILLDAKAKKIKTQLLHAPSILTTMAETGLSLYKFGKTASIPFWEKNFQPESFFDILIQNQKIGAHTLFLLDLRPDLKKFMTVQEAIEVLLKVAKKRKSKLFTAYTHCIACSQLGTAKQIIKVGTANKLIMETFGTPACLIVPGKLADYEKEALNEFA